MKYDEFLKENKDNMLEELMRFVSINSVYDEKTVTKEHPFGAGVEDALAYVAKLGEKYGFKVDRCDGYCTELTIGEGDKMIGIFAHGDVVPPSGVWTDGPFSPFIKDGKIYGRGTSDDKGPFIAAFYAVLALKNAGLIKNYKVRLVVGGDEERGSGCLDYYFKTLKKPDPTYGFTPDADFPLIYGEKGIVNFFPELKMDIPQVKSIRGGVATNAVCDKVEIEFEDATVVDEYLNKNMIAHKRDGDTIRIFGKSAHGSTPELGVNAAIKTLNILGNAYNNKKLIELSEKLGDTTGKAFDGFAESKLLGKTTYCVGMISYEKGLLKFSVNFRYPETVKCAEFRDNFDKHFGTKSELDEESPYLLFDPKSKLVKTLMKAYRKESYDLFHEPITIGGGTYAKHCKNTVAFGALFPGREYVMHQPDEYMPVSDIMKSAFIYARAIYLLGKLK